MDYGAFFVNLCVLTDTVNGYRKILWAKGVCTYYLKRNIGLVTFFSIWFF